MVYILTFFTNKDAGRGLYNGADKRNIGLDIVRSAAILMVLLSHSRWFFTKYFDSGKWSVFGVLGVELFFVLSGFLIGQIIIKDLSSGEWNSLRVFYLRRWFRTLPLYYGLFIFYSLVYKQFHWQHIFFIQNYNINAYQFFTASWSLSVEEWFYLLIPLIILLIMKVTKIDIRKLFFPVCTAIILIETFSRIYYVTNFNPPWDYGIRVNTFLRLDSIVLGVTLAGIKSYYKNLYDGALKYSKYIIFLGSIGFMLVGIYYVYFKGAGRAIDSSFFSRTLLFNVMPLGALMIVAGLEKDKLISSFGNTKLSNIFRFISKTSYSIYLINYDLYQFMLKVNHSSNILVSIMWLIITLAIMFIIAHILYKYYELPIMNLRDRFKRKTERAVQYEGGVENAVAG